MNNPVHILYLEDNPRDAELVRDKLQQASLVCDLRVASSRLEYEGALAETRFDLILSDYNLLDYDGMTALALAREKQPAVPFILISGTLGEEKAVDCMLRGATDYVHKQRLDRLVPAVLRALTEAEDRLQRKLAEVASLASSKRLDFALQASHIGAWEVDLLNHTTYHTLIHDQILGYATLLPSWTYETFLEHVLPEDRPMVDRRFCEAMGAQIPLHFECRIRRPDGEVRWIGVGGGSEQDSAGKVLRMSGIVQDISERKQGENRERLAREVMELLNHPINTRDTIHDILRLIKLSTGFEAVGLRLREGDDFPYYETDGFPEAFVRAENTLTARDPAGGLCQDKNGNLSLECTCGLVISGKTDPANPIFSPGGSFWTNDSFPLLDLPPTQDPRLPGSIHGTAASIPDTIPWR
jgi:PAS domain S-box-containing protein